jgi:ParB family chromosome partitioning protein
MADVTETGAPRSGDLRVPIERIVPNPEQPRKQFTQTDLEDLAASIREKGVIQPLIVRERGPGRYEIVAGERRWRASQLAQLHELPVIVRDFSDQEVLEVAIIENIQRAELNPVEEAAGYQQLIEKFGHTQEKMAEALGKSRAHIANSMRLLKLPEPVLDHLRSGALSAGHARALITSDTPEALARKVISGGLSVRATEAMVKKQQRQGLAAATKPPNARPVKDADTAALEADLSAALRMRVELAHSMDGGYITLHYKTLDQLDDLVRLLGGG